MAAGNVSTSAASSAADRELVFTRVLDAPRELVFEAWTEPRHLAHWWPRGFSTTISEMEVRPGGVWRLVMRGPDGRDYHNRIVFLEVAKPERLVYKHDPEKGSEPVSFQVTVTFAGQGAKTEVTMRMLFPSAAAREHVVKTYGAVAGANQTLDRLSEQLAKMRDPEARVLVMTRIFDAPREMVFKAWTDREHLQRWWGPKGFSNPVCEVDVRPGGAIRIDMRAPNGVVYPMTGVYQEIVEPERLVFTTTPLDEEGAPLFETLNTITFSEHDGRTTQTLRVSVSKATAEAPKYLAGMEQGWSQTLDRLVVEVER